MSQDSERFTNSQPDLESTKPGTLQSYDTALQKRLCAAVPDWSESLLVLCRPPAEGGLGAPRIDRWWGVWWRGQAPLNQSGYRWVRWQHPRSPVLPGRVGRGVTVLKDRPGPAACRRRSSAAQFRNAVTLNAQNREHLEAILDEKDPTGAVSPSRRWWVERNRFIQVTAAALPTPNRQGGRDGGNTGGASGDASSILGSALVSRRRPRPNRLHVGLDAARDALRQTCSHWTFTISGWAPRWRRYCSSNPGKTPQQMRPASGRPPGVIGIFRR